MFRSPDEIGDEILEHLNETESSRSNAIESSLADANACVHAAEKSSMFHNTLEENAMVVDSNDSDHHIETSDHTLEEMWASEYHQHKEDWWTQLMNFGQKPQSTGNGSHSEISIQCANYPHENTVTVCSTEPAVSNHIHIASSMSSMHEVLDEAGERESLIKDFTLNVQQACAFSMIAEHSCGKNTSQLRMFLGVWEEQGNPKSSMPCTISLSGRVRTDISADWHLSLAWPCTTSKEPPSMQHWD